VPQRWTEKPAGHPAGFSLAGERFIVPTSRSIHEPRQIVSPAGDRLPLGCLRSLINTTVKSGALPDARGHSNIDRGRVGSPRQLSCGRLRECRAHRIELGNSISPAVGAESQCAAAKSRSHEQHGSSGASRPQRCAREIVALALLVWARGSRSRWGPRPHTRLG
jgi:hypothetical protein